MGANEVIQLLASGDAGAEGRIAGRYQPCRPAWLAMHNAVGCWMEFRGNLLPMAESKVGGNRGRSWGWGLRAAQALATALLLSVAMSACGDEGDSGAGDGEASSGDPSTSDAEPDGSDVAPGLEETGIHPVVGVPSSGELVARTDAPPMILGDGSGLNSLSLHYVESSDGSVTVIDRSEDVAVPWETFQGSEFASMQHDRIGDHHVILVDENVVAPQYQLTVSVDDGASWTSVQASGRECHGIDPSLTLLQGVARFMTSNGCSGSGEAYVWTTTPSLELAEDGVSPLNVDDLTASCSTDTRAYLASSTWDEAQERSRPVLWALGGGQSDWAQVSLPTHMADEAKGHLKLDCDASGVVVWDETGLAALVGDESATAVGLNVDDAWLSQGVLIVRSDETLQISQDGGEAWTTLLEFSTQEDPTTDRSHLEMRVEAATVDPDGNIWVITERSGGDAILWTNATDSLDRSSPEEAVSEFIRLSAGSSQGELAAVAPVLEYVIENYSLYFAGSLAELAEFELVNCGIRNDDPAAASCTVEAANGDRRNVLANLDADGETWIVTGVFPYVYAD